LYSKESFDYERQSILDTIDVLGKIGSVDRWVDCEPYLCWQNAIEKRWESFSIILHLSHLLSPVVENLVALSAVASALLMSLQVKLLRMGGILLDFQTLHKILLASGVMLLAPIEGS
jgi:hypothetical protein